MAVAENAGVKIGASGQNLDATAVSSDGNASSDSAKSEPRNGAGTQLDRPVNAGANGPADVNGRLLVASGSRNGQMSQMRDGLRSNGSNFRSSGVNNVRELVDMLSKLNPMAEEFVPPSLGQSFAYLADGGFGYPQNFVLQIDGVDGNGHTGRRVLTLAALSFIEIFHNVI